MNKPFIYSIISIFLFSLFAVLGVKAEAADPIKVGVVLPVTGKFAKFGEIEKLSFEMAQEEIKAARANIGKGL